MSYSKLPTVPVRFIRHRDAHKYFGYDRNRFDAEIRPYLTVIKIGVQGIGFDILELDAMADYVKAQRGQPPLKKLKEVSNA